MSPTTVSTPRVTRALVALTVAAGVVGMVLRLLPRSALWLDEALSVHISSLQLGDIPEALRRDGHPPLYYFLLHGWLKLGESDWWVRALSALISAAGIPLAYLAGRRLGWRRGATGLGGTRVGLIAASTWSLLPFAVRYGSETRMYALVSTLVLGGYLLLDNLVGEPRRTDKPLPSAIPSAIGLALVTAALLYSHYWALWLGAATAVVVIVSLVRAVSPDRRRRAWLALGSLAAGVLLFVPWIPAMLFQADNTGTPWGEVFRPATILVVTITDFVGGGFGELQVVSYVLFTVIAVALFGVLRLRAGREVIELTAVPQIRVLTEVTVLLATLGIGWAASAASSSTYASRYSAVVAPLFALAVAGGIAMLRTSRAPSLATAVVCAAFVVGSAGEVVTDRTQADLVADAIEAEVAAGASAGDIAVVACPDQLGPATSRALATRGIDVPVYPYPVIDSDPRFVDWVGYGERNEASDPSAFAAEVAARRGPDTTVYVVANTGYLTFEGKCEALVAEIGASGGSPEVLVAADADNHFESMGLWVSRPPG